MKESNQRPTSKASSDKRPKTAEWPNTIRSRDELDTALEAGSKSGRSKRSIDDIMEDAIKRAEDG